MNELHCPLCGRENDCGVAKGAGTCWCFTARIPEDVLQRVPAEVRGVICVCSRCAERRDGPAAAPPASDELTRNR